MITVKIRKIVPHAKLPKQMTRNAAGYDLFSANETPVVIRPREIALIPTGIAVSIPDGYEGQIRPRSGLAAKEGIGVLNSPGTIDSDYRGEIKVILFNAGDKEFRLDKETRIAQMVISRCYETEFILCRELDETERGEGGFGHTEK
jgi:dUTP pyrophosphatase